LASSGMESDRIREPETPVVVHYPEDGFVTVFVQDWQIDRCGERFALGSKVSWTLAFRPYDEQWGWPDPIVIEVDPVGGRALPDGL
jgi:hypothetical protein